MTDLWTTVGIGLTQVFLTWYGIHVSVPEHRKRNTAIFIPIGLMGVALTVWAAYLSNKEQDSLRSQLNQLTETSKQEAYIGLDHTELEDRNTAIAAHVYVKNKSSVTAANFHGVFHLDTVDTEKPDQPPFERYPGRLALERAFLAANAESDLEKKINPERRSLGPQETVWGTAYLPADKRVRRQLHSGDRVLVVMAHTFYSDEKGEHTGQICRWLQPPANLQRPVWHTCGIHDSTN
jgi:hypothetical protein